MMSAVRGLPGALLVVLALPAMMASTAVAAGPAWAAQAGVDRPDRPDGSGSGARAGADGFEVAEAVDPGIAAAAAWTEHVRTPPAEPVLPVAAGPVSPAHKYFSDVELVDQDGRKRRLYSDLLQGKIVVVAAFLTSCTSSCPVLAERMAAFQERIGDRLGRDVYLLSFTVDPRTDTPARLKQYAERVGARPGWLFLTGSKTNLDWALYKLGAYTGASEDHSNLLILGNEPAGEWKKVFGLAPAEDLLRSLDAVLRDRG
jgi:protein SCO1